MSVGGFGGGGWGWFFLEKASTYAASPFLCCFVWSHSFLHIEKRSQSILYLRTGGAYFIV